MRKVSALLLAMSLLALLVIWAPGRDSEQQLAVVTEIAPKGIARVQAPAMAPRAADHSVAERRIRIFSPDMPLVERPATEPNRTVASAPRPAVADTVGELRVASGVKQSGPTAPPRFGAPVPADDSTRYELIRNLQRELKRVGCYWGEVDGDWGAGSKRSMGAFMERVNATLPIDQPDYILLSLVQGHTGLACGKDCPTGQSLSANGRCTPNVVLTQNGRRGGRDEAAAPRTDGWTTVTEAAPAVVGEPLPGRMAIGGPRTAEPKLDASGLGAVAAAAAGAARTSTSPDAYRPSAASRPAVRSSSSYRASAPSRTSGRRLSYSDVFR